MCDPDCDIISNDVPKMGWSSGKAINPSCECKSHLSPLSLECGDVQATLDNILIVSRGA